MIWGVPPARGPLLLLPTAQAGWWNILNLSQQNPGLRADESPCTTICSMFIRCWLRSPTRTLSPFYGCRCRHSAARQQTRDKTLRQGKVYVKPSLKTFLTKVAGRGATCNVTVSTQPCPIYKLQGCMFNYGRLGRCQLYIPNILCSLTIFGFRR